ncbi:uncharacterized protein DDB_G0284459-like [Linepithema humile]|uniref:uncharacterized protein DDB_G0284459-like n=1 Tax=Linepithema humile TaxID=83485 RepID=UPI00351F50A4
MSIMLIINFVISISAICCATNIAFSTGASVTPITSIKSKRGIVDASQDFRKDKEQSRSVITRSNTQTPRISSSQNINPKSLPASYRSASNNQRAFNANPNHKSGSYAYGSVPKRPLPYPVRQTESAIRNSHLAPYLNALNNPYAQKAATSGEKPLDASKSITSQSLQKLQGAYSPSYNAFYQDKPIELSGFSDFEYPSYASINKLISQSAPTVQVPVYQASYPLSKITDYTSSFPTVASVVAPSSDKTPQGTKQKEATVNVNGKKISVPIIQLQSSPNFSGVLPAFESQPLLLSANYPTETDLGFNFGTGPKFNMALQSRNVSPFLSPLSSFQGQVVPIQTANSSPQFPQYKGASIGVYPVPSNVPKVQGNYESLYSQPQLHFGKEHSGNVQPVNVQQNIVHPSVSTGDILEDAEIINPKNPEPHTPQPDDDEDGERYKHPEKENERSSEDNDTERRPRKYFKESPTESNFKPSTAFPFKEYDERFGKYSRAQSDDEDSDKPYKNYSSLEEDEEEKERDSSSEDRAEYAESPKSSRDSYEEEDEEEEESHKKERREETDEDSNEEVAPKRSKYYVKDFEQEFENSYREELPKEEYEHVKEVPEIDSYDDPKPKQRQKNNNQSPVNHEQPEESIDQEFRVSHKNRKIPKISYRDSMAYGSDLSAKKAPKVIYEESFGYKTPEVIKYSKHAKTEATTIDKYLTAKKSPKEDSYLRAAKYYKFKSPKTGGELISKNKDPYSQSSTNNWKINKSSLEDTIFRSNTKQLSDSSDRPSFHRSITMNGQVRPLVNAEIFHDLTGI